MAYPIGLPHEEIDELMREHIGARAPDDLNRLVDCPLAALEEETKGLRIVFAREPELAGTQGIPLALVVEGDFAVLLLRAAAAERCGEAASGRRDGWTGRSEERETCKGRLREIVMLREMVGARERLWEVTHVSISSLALAISKPSPGRLARTRNSIADFWSSFSCAYWATKSAP